MTTLLADETRVVTIDETQHPIEELPEKAQQLVKFYDDWKQKELDARSELMMIQTAMQGLANQIVAAINEAQQAAQATTEDPPENPAE